MEQYTNLSLQQLSIYELRGIARKVGVKSPTTKRHGELIECILKIQNGEEQAFSTKKGRPPKNISFSNPSSDLNEVEGMPFDYQYAEESSNTFLLGDSEYVDGIFKTTYPCYGVVRDLNGKKYIYDYLNSRHFVNIEEDRITNITLKCGDFVVGEAFAINPKFAVLSHVHDINFSKNKTIEEKTLQKFCINKAENIQQIYSQIIDNSESDIKIVVELEADDMAIVTLRDKCIYFHSAEYDDIKRSYNALLDCSKLVRTLATQNKSFSLYLVDIDYIYSILDAQLTNVKARENLDAVQFLKDILIDVKNSKCGNINIYETNKYKRNTYLDAIINKYLS